LVKKCYCNSSHSSKLKDIDKVIEIIQKEKGKLYILFANAGMAQYVPIGRITEKFFVAHFNINVKGVLFTVQKALPIFVDDDSIILNATSLTNKGGQGGSVYIAIKAAVRSFRVNTLTPGPIDTPMLRGAGKTKEASDKFCA
jgi:NAD(P)-dependent dehydrogenase (short-subunit alcohol dehydrogenase family)